MAWKSFLAAFFAIFLFLHLGCSSSSDDDAESSDIESAQQDDVAENEDEFEEEEEDDEDSEDDEESVALEDEYDDEDDEGDESLAEEDDEDSEEVAEFEDSDEEGDGEDLFAAEAEEESTEVADLVAVVEEPESNVGIDLGADFEGEPEVEAPAEVAEAAAEPIAPASQLQQRGWIPVVKIKSQPHRRAGVLVNAVYIARPGDSVKSISDKIYGINKSKELYSVNPHLYRGVDPGDKLYYNSPHRSQDTSQLLTFAEDNGVPAQTYQTQRGDNIRNLAEKLMGYRAGWKEIWATNPNLTNDEKWGIQAGHTLRYWPSLDAIPAANLAAPLAANEPQYSPDNELATASNTIAEPVVEPEPMEPEKIEELTNEDPFAVEDSLPPAEEEIASEIPDEFDNLDDPFAEPDGSEELASVGAFDPPPAADSQQFESRAQAPTIATPAKSANNDLMMLGAAAGLILVGVGGLVMARKKRLAQKASLDETSFVVEDLEKTEVG